MCTHHTYLQPKISGRAIGLLENLPFQSASVIGVDIHAIKEAVYHLHKFRCLLDMRTTCQLQCLTHCVAHHLW